MKENNEENIIDVQKNYSEEIIQEIQHSIDTNTASIKVLSDINEFPKTIYIDNAKIVLTQLGDRFDSCLYLDVNMSKDDAKKWKTKSICKFYQKDWKRQNKGVNIFENNNYIELKFNVKDAEFVSLLRRVDIELAEDTFALMEYGEIFYNNAHYTIIKAFSPTIGENYTTKSMLENDISHTEKLYDNYGTEIVVGADGKYNIADNGDDVNNMSVEEIADPESEELF